MHSASVTVNAPEAWWILGDGGNWSTNGGKGWVRVVGRSIFFPDEGDGVSQLKLTPVGGGSTLLIPLDTTFVGNGHYTAKFLVPATVETG